MSLTQLSKIHMFSEILIKNNVDVFVFTYSYQTQLVTAWKSAKPRQAIISRQKSSISILHYLHYRVFCSKYLIIHGVFLTVRFM